MAKFNYKNSNPKVDTNDCAPRSIATATGLPWQEVMKELCDIAVEEYRMPNDLVVVSKYLEKLVGPGHQINLLGTGTTLSEFCEMYPQGKYAVQCTNHGVAVIDGEIYDTYDSNGDIVATAFQVG